MSAHISPPSPGNHITTPSHRNQSLYGLYPPLPPSPLGLGHPFPQYLQPPIDAPPNLPFFGFPPPFVPVSNAPYIPQPQAEPAIMRMPEPFQGPPQNPAYPPMAQSPPALPPYLPSYTQWYLGAEISPLHTQRVPQGMMKVPGYDSKGDAQAITNATQRRTLDKKAKEIRASFS